MSMYVNNVKPIAAGRKCRLFSPTSDTHNIKPGFYTSLIAFQTAGGPTQLFAGILFLLSISLFAQTQAAPVIADPASRTTISLDGTWNTIVDPYESGIPSRYYQPPQPKNKSDLIEFDFDRSPKLRVPGDWNSQRDSLLLYEGPPSCAMQSLSRSEPRAD